MFCVCVSIYVCAYVVCMYVCMLIYFLYNVCLPRTHMHRHRVYRSRSQIANVLVHNMCNTIIVNYLTVSGT